MEESGYGQVRHAIESTGTQRRLNGNISNELFAGYSLYLFRWFRKRLPVDNIALDFTGQVFLRIDGADWPTSTRASARTQLRAVAHALWKETYDPLFEAFFRTHFDKVCTLAHHRGMSTASAADLASDAFTRFYKAGYPLGHLDGDPLRAVKRLYTIANRLCFNAWRRHHREPSPRRLRDFARLFRSQDVFNPVQVAEWRDIIEYGMSQLSPADRQILEYFYFHDLSYRQIAKTLRMTERKVERRLCAARARLCRILGVCGSP